MHRIVNELAYSHIFFFIAALLVHILVPKEFPVLLIYCYIGATFVEMAASMLEKGTLNKLAFALQSLFLFIIYIIIMSDDWCRFFLYRGHA
jgi:hypothetical protein